QIEERAIVAMCTDGVFGAADLVIANGVFEADILRRTGGDKFRMEIAGNGRIDILKPRYRAFFDKPIKDVQSRFGDFVLVNTNFQIVNSIWHDLEHVTRIQIQAGFVKPNDPASMQTWRDYLAFEDANRTAMYAAIRLLAKRRPAQRIVVRPHPGEDLKRWDGLFADCKNVAVVREGSHVPWTLACRVLLHSSCTTGFEAYVGGKAALSLVPQPGWISGSLISNQVNPTYETAEQLVAAAERVLDGKPPPVDPAKTAAVERYVWNCAGNDGTKRIAELLTEELPAPKPVLLPPLQGVPRDARLREKFDVSLADAQDSVRRMATAAGIKAKIELQLLGDSLFLVRPPLPAQPAASPDAAAVRPAIKPTREQILSAIDSAFRARNFA